MSTFFSLKYPGPPFAITLLFLDIAYLSQSSLLLLRKRDLDSQHASFFLAVSQADIVDKCRCVAVGIYFFEQIFIISINYNIITGVREKLIRKGVLLLSHVIL